VRKKRALSFHAQGAVRVGIEVDTSITDVDTPNLDIKYLANQPLAPFSGAES
jgi:hypothetical protein